MTRSATLVIVIAAILCAGAALSFAQFPKPYFPPSDPYPKPDAVINMLQVQTLWSGENGIAVGPGLWPISGPQKMDQDLGLLILDRPHAWRHLYLKGSIHVTRGEETKPGLDRTLKCLYGVESIEVRGGVIVGATCVSGAETP